MLYGKPSRTPCTDQSIRRLERSRAMERTNIPRVRVSSSQVPIKEGGTILGGQGEPPDSSSGAFESIKPRYSYISDHLRSVSCHELASLP